jgi:DHA2 family multidrug resistance protein
MPGLDKLPMRAIWLGYIAMIIGNFMAILDIQIVAGSLREIQAGVSASADEIAWIQTSYLIAEVIAIPLSGLLGRAISMRKLFTISAGGFTLMSLACALAWNIESLIFFRTLQGFLGGAMIPTTMAALFLLFPESKRGPAIVLVGMVSTLAPSIGPTLGGWITDNLGWEWLFLINLGPGLLCAIAVWTLSPLRHAEPQLLRSLDVPGLAAMALFLGSLEFVLEEGPRHDWLADPSVFRMALVMVAAGGLFFWRAFTSAHPIVDLRVFANRNFVIGAAVSLVAGFGLYGSVYLLPLFLGGVRGYTTTQIGEVMVVTGAAMFLTAPLIGKLQGRIDLRLLLGVGIMLTAFGMWENAKLTAESGFWDLALPQALRGAGMMMCMIPMTGLALGTLPPDRVQNASALFNLTRNLGGALGLAIINSMIAGGQAMHRTELATAVSTGHADAQAWLDQTAASLAAQGVADPAAAALARLSGLVEREAMVMALNNVFVALALAFALLLPLVLLTRRAGAAPPGAAHKALVVAGGIAPAHQHRADHRRRAGRGRSAEADRAPVEQAAVGQRLAALLLLEEGRIGAGRREPHRVALDSGDEPAAQIMVMALVRAAVVPGELDPVALDLVDGADRRAVGAHHLHVRLDLAEVVHLLSLLSRRSGGRTFRKLLGSPAAGVHAAPRQDHRADDAAAEQGALQPTGRHRADRPEPALAEQAADLVEPQPRLREAAGEQVEAAAHQPPADQRDDDPRDAAGQRGGRHPAPERSRPPRQPGAEADRAAEQRPFDPAGNVPRRLAEQKVERVEPEQLDRAADDQPAERAAGDAPRPAPPRREACRGDPEAHPRRPDQRDQDGEAEQDEQHRGRAHAGLERLRGPGEAVEQAAEEAGDAAADRPRPAEQQDAPPAAGRSRLRAGSPRPCRDCIRSPRRRDRRDEAVAVLGHRLDEARPPRVVAELPAQRPDALGQCLVGDRHAAPHLVHEALLRDQPALLADQQGERVEIARVELDRRAVAAELAVARIEDEAVETIGAGRHRPQLRAPPNAGKPPPSGPDPLRPRAFSEKLQPGPGVAP